MHLLLALLLLVGLHLEADPDPASGSHIDELFGEISNTATSSEGLWTVVQYLTENQDQRLQFASKIADQHPGLSARLNEEEPATSDLEELSVYYENEHLHLYLQLTIYSEDERIDRFNSFYESIEDPELFELNRSIAYEYKPDDTFLDDDGWDFALFLLLLRSHQLELSSDFYERVKSRLEQAEDEADQSPDIVKNYYHASRLLTDYNLNRFHQIASRYGTYINLTRLPETSVKRNIYRLMDFALYYAGQIDLSLEVQRLITLPLSEQLGDRETVNDILANHGGYLYTIGRFTEARDVFERALDDSEHLTDRIRTRLLNNLSLVYYKLGEQTPYIETQMQAHTLAVEQEDLSYQLSIYRNLHIYYRQNQNWDLAQQYIEHAREIAEEAGDRQELASIIISQAVYFDQYLNDSDQALSLLEEAELLLEESTNYRLRVRLLTEKADLLNQLEKHEESLAIYKEVQSIASDNSNNFMYIGALVDLADTELRMGHLERASDFIREFNAHDVTILDFPGLVDARRVEADLAIRQGDYRRAESLIDLVFPQVIERARNTTDIEGGYWRGGEAYLDLFQLYAQLLMDQDRGEELLVALDQLKTINDAALFENPLIQAEQLSEEELAENRRILQELDQLRKQYLTVDEGDRLALRNEMATLNAQKNRLTRERVSEDESRLKRIWTIRSQLRRGEVILHTTRIMDQFYLLVMDKHKLRYQRLTIDDDIDRTFRQGIRGLSRGDTDLDTLYSIYNWLELDKLPRHTRSLIVIPDSYLYHLPLGVLPVEKPDHRFGYGSASYLTENLDIRYLNHMSDMNRRSPRQSYTYDFSGFGISNFDHIDTDLLVPLPGAPREVEGIASILSGRGIAEAITEAEGTPLRFRERTSNSRILHLASHSQISDNDPLFSRIYLAEPAGVDVQSPSGQIFAYQLFDMELNSELIMFNSCESGAGETLQGAGVMGLSRALRYAGAQSLVLNSWIVNDQLASEFAIRFYKELEKGHRKSKALSLAQKHFMNHHNANPHFWGAYIINGNDRPLYQSHSHHAMTFTLALLLIAGLILTRRQLGQPPNQHRPQSNID